MAPAKGSTLVVATLGQLLRDARAKLGLEQRELAERMGVSGRTLGRWEQDEGTPSRRQLDTVVRTFAVLDGDTWRTIVAGLGMSIEAALDACPAQRPLPRATDAQARAALDAAVRRCAEDADVSPRRLRAALATLLAEVDRLGLDAAHARELVGKRGD
jgi:transcriptional regulator with XRE-family HTH domain